MNGSIYLKFKIIKWNHTFSTFVYLDIETGHWSPVFLSCSVARSLSDRGHRQAGGLYQVRPCLLQPVHPGLAGPLAYLPNLQEKTDASTVPPHLHLNGPLAPRPFSAAHHLAAILPKILLPPPPLDMQCSSLFHSFVLPLINKTSDWLTCRRQQLLSVWDIDLKSIFSRF